MCLVQRGSKFWIEPVVALADFQEINKKQLGELQKAVEEKSDEITKALKKHFRG